MIHGIIVGGLILTLIAVYTADFEGLKAVVKLVVGFVAILATILYLVLTAPPVVWVVVAWACVVALIAFTIGVVIVAMGSTLIWMLTASGATSAFAFFAFLAGRAVRQARRAWAHEHA